MGKLAAEQAWMLHGARVCTPEDSPPLWLRTLSQLSPTSLLRASIRARYASAWLAASVPASPSSPVSRTVEGRSGSFGVAAALRRYATSSLATGFPSVEYRPCRDFLVPFRCTEMTGPADW